MAPPEITGDLRKRIDAGLLRIDAARHSPERATRPSVTGCLERAYDVYAGELSRAGWPLSETLLTEAIPAWVFEWALARRWLDMTRYYARRPLSDAHLKDSVRQLLTSRAGGAGQ
jgi:hypothetical protein